MITLSGGNYGGLEVDASEEVQLIAVQSAWDSVWFYSANLNNNTATAEYIGVGVIDDPRIAEATTLLVNMQGMHPEQGQ